MERDLVELFEAAKKAADSAAADCTPAEEGRCLDALKNLKSFPVNYHLLASTQVGKRLRNLTKHPKKTIQSLALELLQLWKTIVIDETTNNKKEEDNYIKTESVTNMVYEKTCKIQKIDAQSATNMVYEKTSEVEKTDCVTEATSNMVYEKINHIQKTDTLKITEKKTVVLKCNDPARDKIREILFEALSKVPSEFQQKDTKYDPISVAVSVESALFENWGRSNGIHKNKYRSVMFNLKDASNPDFRRKVLMGDLRADEVPKLSPEEMASDRRQMENMQIKEKAMFECERGGAPKATTDQFKCGRCKQRKCTYYQLQTRSADEPMTTFVTCVNCNNHWKFC